VELELFDQPEDAGDVAHQIERYERGEVITEPWFPQDDNAAEWAAAKYASAKAGYDQIDAEVKQIEARVKEWARNKRMSGIGGRYRATVELFDQILRRYAIEVVTNSPKDRKGEPLQKRVDLLSARIQTRTTIKGHVPGHLVAETKELVDWCIANARDALMVDIDALPPLIHDGEKVVNVDGEIVPGVRWVEERPGFPDTTASVQVKLAPAVGAFEAAALDEPSL
jgi:hypothetical protein